MPSPSVVVVGMRVTRCRSGAELETSRFGSPLYVATMLWSPAASPLESVTTAWATVSEMVPSGVVPSMKVTDPVGAGAPAGTPTVAVNATGAPGVDGLRLDVSVVVVAALIVRKSGWEVAGV